jgi:hypothetical protein
MGRRQEIDADRTDDRRTDKHQTNEDHFFSPSCPTYIAIA